MDKDVLKYLLTYVSENKRQKFENVLANRTRFLTVVLEDILQPQNISAAVRSCESFGIQDLHIIEKTFPYRINKQIVRGASKWIDIYKYPSESGNTGKCIEALKRKGYKILVTTPHTGNVELDKFTLSGKTAIVFGSEPEGVSSEAMGLADGFLKIPMSGFTESLNISVAAGICLYHLSTQLRASDLPWQLSDFEKEEIMTRWVRSVVRKADLLEQNFLKSFK